jgi:DNA-binding transcriptional MerR regulator
MMDFLSAGEAPANSDEFAGESQDGFVRIGEMAKTYGVTLRTLRFYEDKGLINPKREGTSRLYSRRDRVRLKLILLGRKVGFSLRDVKQMLDLYDPTGSNIKQLKLTLEKSEKQLARLNKQRAALDEAIGDLTQAMTAVRGLLETRQAKARSN